jgi:hypothetical protein
MLNSSFSSLVTCELADLLLMIVFFHKQHIFFTWTKIRYVNLKLKFHWLFAYRHIRLKHIFEHDFNTWGITITVTPTQHRNTKVNVSGDGKVQLLSITVHRPGVPYVIKVCLQVLLLEEVAVDQNVLILR